MKQNTSSENNTKLNFPHISKNKPISKKTLDLVIGELPKNFDIDKVQDEMWEEFAKNCHSELVAGEPVEPSESVTATTYHCKKKHQNQQGALTVNFSFVSGCTKLKL